MQSRWVEIPAHRVLLVPGDQLNGFRAIAEHGGPPRAGEMIYRLIRERDGKIFMVSEWQPRDAMQVDVVALREP